MFTSLITRALGGKPKRCVKSPFGKQSRRKENYENRWINLDDKII
jgi:hypothetical protein